MESLKSFIIPDFSLFYFRILGRMHTCTTRDIFLLYVSTTTNVYIVSVLDGLSILTPEEQFVSVEKFHTKQLDEKINLNRIKRNELKKTKKNQNQKTKKSKKDKA